MKNKEIMQIRGHKYSKKKKEKKKEWNNTRQIEHVIQNTHSED